jgi:hypothetical protein
MSSKMEPGRIVFGAPYVPAEVQRLATLDVIHDGPFKLSLRGQPRQPTEAEIAAGQDMVALADHVLGWLMLEDFHDVARRVRRIGRKLQGKAD